MKHISEKTSFSSNEQHWWKIVSLFQQVFGFLKYEFWCWRLGSCLPLPSKILFPVRASSREPQTGRYRCRAGLCSVWFFQLWFCPFLFLGGQQRIPPELYPGSCPSSHLLASWVPPSGEQLLPSNVRQPILVGWVMTANSSGEFLKVTTELLVWRNKKVMYKILILFLSLFNCLY